MGAYFGTDGIRGLYGVKLTPKLAFDVGNALCQIQKHPNIVIGNDTRLSSDILSLSLSAGILNGGGNVTNVKIIPTAGISFLVKNFDFGVMITASHNPADYNGIKIFNNDGEKLSDEQENQLEQYFSCQLHNQKIGKYAESENFKIKYINHLKNACKINLTGLKICVDASNGAAYKIAPLVFKKLGAEVVEICCSKNGEHINENCGCLHIENLQNYMKSTGADIGFAFDGDADRVFAVDSNNKVFDGDKLLYILAKDFKNEGNLTTNSIVGTSQTNHGIMNALNRSKINLIRTDVGDKYVIETMEKMNINLGGEQSGHIIIKDYSNSGDGILAAIKICETVVKNKKSLSQLFDAKIIPQINRNIKVNDKIKIINNEHLNNLINKLSKDVEPYGRILVRASGTEDLIRVMVEHINLTLAEKYCKAICKQIEQIN